MVKNTQELLLSDNPYLLRINNKWWTKNYLSDSVPWVNILVHSIPLTDTTLWMPFQKKYGTRFINDNDVWFQLQKNQYNQKKELDHLIVHNENLEEEKEDLKKRIKLLEKEDDQ